MSADGPLLEGAAHLAGDVALAVCANLAYSGRVPIVFAARSTEPAPEGLAHVDGIDGVDRVRLKALEATAEFVTRMFGTRGDAAAANESVSEHRTGPARPRGHCDTPMPALVKDADDVGSLRCVVMTRIFAVWEPKLRRDAEADVLWDQTHAASAHLRAGLSAARL